MEDITVTGHGQYDPVSFARGRFDACFGHLPEPDQHQRREDTFAVAVDLKRDGGSILGNGCGGKGQWEEGQHHEGDGGSNSTVSTVPLCRRLEGDVVAAAVADADLVLDATDNLASRIAINRLCVDTRAPLVSGAAIRMEGQVAVFDTRQGGSPCYQCLYPQGEGEELNCAENGVIAPLVGIIGAVQAMEAVKLIVGVGETLVGHVLYLDAKRMEWRKFTLPKNPKCAVCDKRGEPEN